MVQYVLTPWRDRRELLLVRRQFYHDDDDGGRSGTSADAVESRAQRRKAVARVSMWMQRGNCPHMVESTALLMAAVLSDEDSCGSGSGYVNDGAASAAYAMRAAYSAAFSRFVTGLLDGHQDKQRKQSMYSVAKTIGLPATFVELRHQSTHEQLPSLAKLRSAARKALSWIWGYYWRHLPTEEGDGGPEEAQGVDECDKMVLKYLKEDDEGRRDAIVTSLKERWGREVVPERVRALQGTLPGNQAYLKCLKLLREILEDDIPKDAQPQAEENRNEQEGAGESQPTLVADPGDDDDCGWSLYPGHWKPKPIGIA